MSSYLDDRTYTDYIHSNIAIPTIYNSLNWQQVLVEEAMAKHIDMFKGIDYVFEKDGILKTVQERFREKKYEKYNDFTIRYRRDGNYHTERQESEHYKIEADFFTYGITNCLKTDLVSCTAFLKYAVIDLTKIYEKITIGEIIVEDNKKNFCEIKNDKLICPIKYNTDGSSSFFPIDIPLLVKLWGGQMIVKQYGYY